MCARFLLLLTALAVASVQAAPEGPLPDSGAAPKSIVADTMKAVPVRDTAASSDSARAPAADSIQRLSIDGAVDLLLRENSEIGKARETWFASRDKYRASFGAFEPALVGSWDYQASDRPYVIYGQRQNNYAASIEGVLPSATKYNLGFQFSDIENRFIDNVNRPTAFSGLTLTQPLLQGLWFGKPVSDIKFARAERGSAFHRYRSTLCGLISELQAGYWKLRSAQDKVRYTMQSVATAHELVADAKIRFRVGKISEVDTIEATAGLATRQAAYSNALMELNSAISALKVLIAGESPASDLPVEATSPLEAPGRAFLDSLAARLDIGKILSRQPDFLEKKFETQKQRVSLGAQADQCLPEVTVKGSWGYQVTGTNPSAVWAQFTDAGYRYQSPTYSAGVEVRIPLALNIKERGLYSAEKRVVRQAEIDENATRVQVENYIHIAMQRLFALRSNIENAKIVVDFRQTLLAAEISRQRVGKSDYHKIFDMEEELTKAKISAAENSVEFLGTLGQLQRLTGSTLMDRGLETMDGGEPALDKRLINPAGG